MAGALHALEGIFEVLFMVSIGLIMAKLGWCDSKTSGVMTKIVLKISLPLYMLAHIVTDFDHDLLVQMAPDLVLPFASILLSYGIGVVIAMTFHIAKNRQGVFITCFCIANTIFIGLPVNLALFGPPSVPSVMLYYMANTMMFWTVGVYHIVHDSTGGATMPLFSPAALKKVLSPPLIGFLLGIVLVMMGLGLPDFIVTSFKYVGNMATPLSLIVIGIEMSTIAFQDIHWDRDIVGALIGRFIICPACVLCLLPFIPVTEMSAKVFTMQASMPAMTQMTVVAKAVGADVKYSTELSFLTIVLAIVVIPVYMILFG